MRRRAGAGVDPVLRAWIESATEPTALVDAAGRYVALNDAYRAWLALPPDVGEGQSRDLVLRTWLLPRLRDARPLTQWLAELADGSRGPCSLTVEAGVGSSRWWHGETRALTTHDGALLAWREAWTEHREATAPRQERPSADEALARVSHELRTPMTAIVGFCHILLLESSGLVASQAESVRKILRNAMILQQLLTNVLDLAKMERQGIKVALEAVDPADLAHEAVEAVEPLLWGRDLQVEVACDGLPAVQTDRLRAKQVLINLLSNAVKYTDQGLVRVTGRCLQGGLALAVSDTGEGIPAEQLERVFEPYVQIDSERQRRIAGNGLGLAIVKGLLAVLGGRISVQSQVGVGSTFTVWLPLAGRAPASG
ncbi:MAG: HAMP domain-containing histidine kinase [Fimbriimonadaceae bacterium]|nr:HAMP domain-containing histidine kinase [Fimbriimonadaceae bacterium]